MQILKKRELSRKSELKQVLWSELPILAGVSAAGGRDAGVKWTVKPEAACVRSECGEAEGSGRHRAGSSWGILSGTGCSPPWVTACPQVEKALPSRESLSPRLSTSTDQPLFQQQPTGPGPCG